MAAPKRNKLQREADLLYLTEHYLKQRPLAEITEEINEMRDYNLSRQQVSYDLKTVQQRWQDSYLVDFDAAKAKELARIDELERAYWEGWTRSIEKRSEIKRQQIEDEGMIKGGRLAPSYTRNKVEMKEMERDGDTKFLDGIQWCIEQRCKIFGLDAPRKIQVDRNWRAEAEKQGVNPEEVYSDAVNEFITAAGVGRRHAGGGVEGS